MRPRPASPTWGSITLAKTNTPRPSLSSGGRWPPAKKAQGADDKDLAGILFQLAEVYRFQKRYTDAQQPYQRTVAIYDKLKQPDASEATVLARFASNQLEQGKYAEAEDLGKQAVAVSEKAYSPEHPSVADGLMELSSVYMAERKYADAEAADQRALAIYEKAPATPGLGAVRAIVALVGVYSLEGKQAETEPLIQRLQTLVSRLRLAQMAPNRRRCAERRLGLSIRVGHAL